MEDKEYEALLQKTEDLIRNQSIKELKNMKETNVRLIQAIGALLSICLGVLSWYVKGVSDNIDKFIISTNTLEIHQVITDKAIDKLERRVQALEQQRYQP